MTLPPCDAVVQASRQRVLAAVRHADVNVAFAVRCCVVIQLHHPTIPAEGRGMPSAYHVEV